MLSVLIPANNEEGYIGPCLDALLAQQGPGLDDVEVVVAANACTDATVALARGYTDRFAARGWRLEVLDIAEGGKPNALDHADAAATPMGPGPDRAQARLYLDADIVCAPEMLSQLVAALDREDAAWASGRLVVAPAKSWVTRHYARLWSRLPFMTRAGATGAGLFAVNAAGRARWDAYPRIIGDDTFVRLQFTPAERHDVGASYLWPMVEGFAALVKVRRRQDAGNREIREKWPDLFDREGKPDVPPGEHLRLFLGTPVSYLVYVSVAVAVRLGHRKTGQQAWSRGR